MKRHLLTILLALSLLLFVAVVVLWVRSYWVGSDVRLTHARFVNHATIRTVYGVSSSAGGVAFRRDGGVTHIPPGSRRHSHYGEEIATVPAARFTWTREEVRRGEWPGLPAYQLENMGVKGWLGFVLLNRFGGATYGDIYWSQRALVVPYWFLAALSLLCLLPTARAVVRRVRTEARTGGNRCPSCGYDLRATPERCPECGHQTASA